MQSHTDVALRVGNAKTEDLWDAMTEAAKRVSASSPFHPSSQRSGSKQAGAMDLDVAAVMGGWTEQMGYPYLQVEETGERWTISWGSGG